MPAINPEVFLSDPQVKPFTRDQRVDLAAGNVETLNDEEFVVYRNVTKQDQIEVIHYIAPYAMARTDVGTPQESFQMLDPASANGHFVYSPKVNGQTAVVLNANLNSATDSTGTLNNNERNTRGGITHLSADPWIDSQRYNPLFSIPVPSRAEFLVTFALLQPSDVSPMPNPFQVGAGPKRVDFAGVVIQGMLLPQQLYDELIRAESAHYARNFFDLLRNNKNG